MASFCYLPVNDSTIALRTVGAGEPVLLLHSSASGASQWRRIAAALAERHRVCMPDFPGYGDSSRWRGARARSLAADATIVDAIATHLGEPVHLVGHSYGGAVALAAAHDHPDTVRTLALIEPVAFHLLDGEGDASAASEITRLAEAVWHGLITGDHAGAMARFVDYWNGAGTWQGLAPERRQQLAETIANIGQEFAAVLGCRLVVEDYGSIAVPTAVLSGVSSPWPARRVAEIVATALPSARLHVMAGAGHMLPLSHPEETAAVLIAHLAGRTAAERPLSRLAAA